MNPTRLLTTALAVTLLLARTAVAAGPALKAVDPWVREAPPGMTVLAAFMVLRNDSDQPLQVVQVSSPQFGHVEMHRTVVSEGVARMLKQEQLEVPARGRLTLAPGGYHLMLFDPTAPLRAGDTVHLILRLRHGGELDVTAPVRKGAKGMGGMMHQHP